MDENNNIADNTSKDNGQLLTSQSGRVICEGETDLESNDEDDSFEEKSYQTLSSVKYDEAPPHVIEAVRGLSANSNQNERFCSGNIFAEKSAQMEVTPMSHLSSDSPPTQRSHHSGQTNPINCSFPLLTQALSNTNTTCKLVTKRCEISPQQTAMTCQATIQTSSINQNNRKRAHGSDTTSSHQVLCNGKQARCSDNRFIPLCPPDGHSRSRSPQPAVASPRSLPTSIVTSSSYQTRPICWQPCNADPPAGPALSQWAIYDGCERNPEDQTVSNCHLTQTLLIPDLGRSSTCSQYSNSGNSRPPNPWANFRPMSSAAWNEPSGQAQTCETSRDPENLPPESEPEIRNETFPMTRRYIIRSMLNTSSPTNQYRPGNRTSVAETRRFGDSEIDPHPPFVQRPYAYPSAMPNNVQMLSRNLHFVNNFGVKNYSGNGIVTSYKNKAAILPDVTQGYDVISKGLPPHISTKDVFCLVPGRLGMPNQSKRHEVLVGEILRRVLTPESLNISLLGPILRKAKSKNGTQYLREKLQQIGVELPPGRRKTAKCTLFTSLTESEAGQLAEDFSKLCQCEFPAKALAKKALQRRYAEESAAYKSESIASSLELLDCFIELLGTKPFETFNEPNVTFSSNRSSSTSSQLYNYETLTHGFGLKALISSLRTFRAFLLYLEDERISDAL
uniref:AP-2-like1 transcription factor protein n=1 Tax=Phallusia mammillata TaxID=59560 RepID=A0A6F9DVB5_9ASCI|nr:AP-2-like1 transcription factor protein [Phallusia mammillata]